MYLLISYYSLQNYLFSLLTVLNRSWRSCYELHYQSYCDNQSNTTKLYFMKYHNKPTDCWKLYFMKYHNKPTDSWKLYFMKYHNKPTDSWKLYFMKYHNKPTYSWKLYFMKYHNKPTDSWKLHQRCSKLQFNLSTLPTCSNGWNRGVAHCAKVWGLCYLSPLSDRDSLVPLELACKGDT